MNAHFHVEFINGRRTDVRKCVKFGEKLKWLSYFTDVLEVVGKAVNFILGKPKLMDKQMELEKTAKLPQLRILKENATRWNSLFSMLDQLLKLKTYPVVISKHGIITRWFRLEETGESLQHLESVTRVTLLLQVENAGVSMAIKAVKFPKHLTNSDPALNSHNNHFKETY